MKSIHLLISASLALAAGMPALHASDRTAVYAKIDRVEIENDTARVYGVFAAAKPNDGRDYLAPVRGYLYFKIGSDAELTRKEWNDLKQVAGTADLVAFGTRPFTARIRKADEKPENPDPYKLDNGVVRVRARTDYPPVRSLLDFKN
jgi:hypothetical protein